MKKTHALCRKLMVMLLSLGLALPAFSTAVFADETNVPTVRQDGEDFYSESNMTAAGGSLDNLWDHDHSTTYKTTLTNGAYIDVISRDVDGKHVIFHGDSITIYATEETAKNITAVTAENPRFWEITESDTLWDSCTTASTPNWVDADRAGIKKCVIKLDKYRSASHKYRVKLTGTGSLELTDIELDAEVYRNDLADYTTVYRQEGDNLTELPKSDAAMFFDGLVHKSVKIASGQVYVLDFGFNDLKLSSFYSASNYPKSQSVTEGKLEYWDGKKWVPIDAAANYAYKVNDQQRELGGFTFDPVTTNKVRFTIVKAASKWPPIIQEILICGERQERSVNVEELANELIIPPQEADSTAFCMPVLPEEIAADYIVTLVSSSDETVVALDGTVTPPDQNMAVDLTFRVAQKSNPDNYADTTRRVNIPARTEFVPGLNAKTEMATAAGSLENLFDGSYETTWKSTLANKELTVFTTPDVLGEVIRNRNFTNEKLTIWATEATYKNLSGVKVLQYYAEDRAPFEFGNIPAADWTKDNGLMRLDLTMPKRTASCQYAYMLMGSGEFEMAEFKISGKTLAYDLGEFATISRNGTVLSDTNAHNLVDTAIMKNYAGVAKGDVFEFDFAPFVLDLDFFYLTQNFPKSQSVLGGKLEYYDSDDNAWKLLQERSFDWKTDNDLREVNGFDFPMVSTSRVRLTVTGVGTAWGTTRIAEVYVGSKKTVDLEALAAGVKTVPSPKRTDKKIAFPTFPSACADLCTVSIASSEPKGLIAADGTITLPEEDTKVSVVFTITDKKSGKKADTKPVEIVIPAGVKDSEHWILPAPDLYSFLRNPGMGWMIYVEKICNWDGIDGIGAVDHIDTEKSRTAECVFPEDVDAFFGKLDDEIAKGMKPSILYIRLGWNWFEPEEGEYAWKDPDSTLSRYLEEAKKRDLQIAFRVTSSDDPALPNGTGSDQYMMAPAWLFEKEGFTWYYLQPNTRPTPYYNNPVYLECYERFIEAFAERFNDDPTVAFLDAQGLGMWGEMHSVKGDPNYPGSKPDEIVENHAKIWTKYFDKVLLGATFGGVAQDVNRYTIVPKYNHMYRKDALGEDIYITSEVIGIYLTEMFSKRIPFYGETCYWHLNYEKNSVHSIKDIRANLERCIYHAQVLRCNALDLRVPADWVQWTGKGLDLVDQFTRENGYRIMPTELIFTKSAEPGESIVVRHSWKNTALGFLPTSMAQWKDRYKVSFALLNDDNEVVYQFVETTQADPCWIQEDGEQSYNSAFELPTDLLAGNYKLGVALVNTENGNKPEIRLAVDMPRNEEGWYIADSIAVGGVQAEPYAPAHTVKVDDGMEHGTVWVNSSKTEAGAEVVVTFTPDEGYRLVEGSLMANSIPVINGMFTMPDEDVVVTAQFEETPSSRHTITIDENIEHGTLKISEGKTVAATWENVNVNAFPEEGYQLKDGSIKVNGRDLNYYRYDAIKAFSMPNEDVTITAEFEPVDILGTLVPILKFESDGIILRGRTSTAGRSFYYKTTDKSDAVNKPDLDSTDLSGWTSFSKDTFIPAAEGEDVFVQVILVVDGKIKAWGEGSEHGEESAPPELEKVKAAIEELLKEAEESGDLSDPDLLSEIRRTHAMIVSAPNEKLAEFLMDEIIAFEELYREAMEAIGQEVDTQIIADEVPEIEPVDAEGALLNVKLNKAASSDVPTATDSNAVRAVVVNISKASPSDAIRGQAVSKASSSNAGRKRAAAKASPSDAVREQADGSLIDEDSVTAMKFRLSLERANGRKETVTTWAAPIKLSMNVPEELDISEKIIAVFTDKEGKTTAIPVTADPDTGRISFVLTGNGTVTFANTSETVTEDTYYVTVDGDIEGGKLTVNPISGKLGTRVTVKAVPESGYILKALYVNGEKVSVDTNRQYTFILTEDTEISAEFEEITDEIYEVTVASDIVGGKLTVNHTSGKMGTRITVKAVPESGYILKALYVNGEKVSVDANRQYTFLLTGDTEIGAEFEEITDEIYEVTVASGIVGGRLTVNHTSGKMGTRITVKAIPDSRYELKALYVNGEKVSVDKNRQYTFLLTGDTKISAEFVKSESSSHGGGSGSSSSRSVHAVRNPIWLKDDNGWKLYKPDRSYAAGEWQYLGGLWYHFGENGYMQTGWIMDQDKWYYLQENGAMAHGWICLNNEWYYLCDNSVEGHPYGSLYVNTVTPDNYRVNESGLWIQ